jgi:hypothetical protein
MKKLSIIATTSILAAIMVVGCGDDTDDNPGAPTSGTKGNEGGCWHQEHCWHQE